ncbi:DNA polymerase [Aeromonas phage BUCT551]|uniref:Putative DNA polymerase n=1 Tax=Aeromonas phage BUCT551 TaxID=2776735 RepID=A0A7L8ZLG4_9CAUD|nr:DNA polymerase [Aeromonas phage BUCT551]QOI69684.1 putative DNA polymerase [Aeromonas phage BUCT551]
MIIEIDEVNLDIESRSELDLPTVGLDRYVNHESTEIIMVAWQVNEGPLEQWDISQGPPPARLIALLSNPKVRKWAFNAQFERVMFEKLWGIPKQYRSWRCTQALAYMMGFFGTLDQVGKAADIPEDKAKSDEGKALINLFSKPQRITKANTHRWRDWRTNPVEWARFCAYNRQDVVAERFIKRRLVQYPIPEFEWEVYAVDQRINDRGVMINVDHAEKAIKLAAKRKPQIIKEMKEITKLGNPNSPAQLLPWLQDRGYPFGDLQKDTVKKAVREAKETGLKDLVVTVLQKRLASNKQSLAKYRTMLSAIGPDNRFRYSLQFAGAQRTSRWAGRRIQVQNLPRTPKTLEDVEMMRWCNLSIHREDLEFLDLLNGEPMESLAGAIRSSFVPGPGKKFVVADLSSIESVVIGWLCKCRWIEQTLDRGHDLYRSFAAEWLNIPYEETKPHRSKAKPATLGAGYRLGGGDIGADGKKTGLWGYGENMQVFMTREEAHSSVRAFRELCPEIVQTWYAIERAVQRCIKTRENVKVVRRPVEWESEPVELPISIEWRAPFLCVLLPSGRRLYYKNPKLKTKKFKSTRPGESDWEKENFHYMGKMSNGNKWVEIASHGGKLVENIVQAIARDILANGLRLLDKHGSAMTHIKYLVEAVMHVHDEIVAEVDKRCPDEEAIGFLMRCMTKRPAWARDLRLGAAGYCGDFYRKD